MKFHLLNFRNSCAVYVTYFIQKFCLESGYQMSQEEITPDEIDKRRIQLLVDLLDDADEMDAELKILDEIVDGKTQIEDTSKQILQIENEP